MSLRGAPSHSRIDLSTDKRKVLRRRKDRSSRVPPPPPTRRPHSAMKISAARSRCHGAAAVRPARAARWPASSICANRGIADVAVAVITRPSVRKRRHVALADSHQFAQILPDSPRDLDEPRRWSDRDQPAALQLARLASDAAGSRAHRPISMRVLLLRACSPTSGWIARSVHRR